MAQDDTNASYDPLDVARSIIDRDIAQLEESIRLLKSRRNELSPISRLPPEILCIIFSFIEDRNASHRSPEAWINFSRVSQHWRSLALSAPELWTNIPLNYPRWAQEMLTRSKMANLTIRHESRNFPGLDLRDFTSLETIKSCLSHMERLGEINISRAPGSTLENIFQDLPKSAPQLHTFRIESIPVSPHSVSPFTIHEDFLCDTKRLKCVRLVNCTISWDSRLLTDLTRLTLYGSLKDNTASSITQFLDALQRMPGLTELDLQDSIPHDSGGLSTYPAVNLPCLRVLRISSGIGPLTIALRYITFPPNAVLNLTCKETHSVRINFSNFLSVLAAKFLSSLAIRSLSLRESSQNSLRFVVWTTANARDDFVYSLGPAQLELVLTWPTTPSPSSSRSEQYTKTSTAVFNVMNLCTLTQLHISTADRIDSKTWLKAFGKLPLLERVHVFSSSTAQPFLDALVYKPKAADKSKSAYRTVSFPKLRHIYLECTHFVETNFEQTNEPSISINMLMDCLMERYERNAEIQLLRLDDCYNISGYDIERLAEIVVDVIWDGVEQTGSTEYDSEEDRDYYYSDGTIEEDLDSDYYDYL